MDADREADENYDKPSSHLIAKITHYAPSNTRES